ncbi:response regulator transcription factor [Dolosigranulum pigrum]|uniref:Response regulator transcription factor n=1 Tax=Dolosigranulum savutiense TaxID=3110288 RepID=A0AB74U5Z2_9LACT|nr:response regulator transcription factor [Dolosigranulum pigrum]QJS98113.1 response regulator transcription factor [Dolosigranulum pigrum]QTJ41369.1 response regulator transcription factor [Dolosigranulum pigrum]QTJ43066.1 response regulator transcription factor [Dolosigranulum pigrum]QTJ46469.1 response regulator transcription factor [Dolosigranulum pigrum]QTJ59992.1 response regulator transcription factor [Dolosigranulum pigrum]
MKILLIDDHKLFSQSLALVLDQTTSDVQVDMINSEGELPDDLSELTVYDVLVLDINLDKGFSEDGFELAERVRAVAVDLPILMLTGFDLPVYEYQAHKLELSGFVNKNIGTEDLLSLLKHVKDGGRHFTTENWFIDELTPRERELLGAIATGKKRKMIAEELYISERTLTNHMQSIMDKLEVNSTIEAIQKARELGYLK